MRTPCVGHCVCLCAWRLTCFCQLGSSQKWSASRRCWHFGRGGKLLFHLHLKGHCGGFRSAVCVWMCVQAPAKGNVFNACASLIYSVWKEQRRFINKEAGSVGHTPPSDPSQTHTHIFKYKQIPALMMEEQASNKTKTFPYKDHFPCNYVSESDHFSSVKFESIMTSTNESIDPQYHIKAIFMINVRGCSPARAECVWSNATQPIGKTWTIFYCENIVWISLWCPLAAFPVVSVISKVSWCFPWFYLLLHWSLAVS